MRKTKILLTAALAAVLVTALAVGSTLAYFTAHKEATGSAGVELGYQTELKEKVDGLTKTVTITNNEDSKESVWVRAKAYSFYDLTYTLTDPWTAPDPEDADADGFYFYNEPLAPDHTTTNLVISIEAKDLPEDAEDFNIVVVYEVTRVMYDEETGDLLDPDWDLKLTVETVTGDASEEETTEGGEPNED